MNNPDEINNFLKVLPKIPSSGALNASPEFSPSTKIT